ncbi:MAG TPA: methyltransferase [Myxococcales bacterium]|nr:methyltransferase [Myxococcales bacterium]
MDPLASLGRALRERGYAFVTPTPETHRRVLARGGPARTLRDVFGWSKPFGPGVLEPELMDWLEAAGALHRHRGQLKSGVRFSSLGPLLLAHSAYPTTAADAVFFGPDTYRFAAFLRARAPAEIGMLADVGCGTGAGGLLLAPRARSVALLDVSENALRFSRANCELNGLDARTVQSDVLEGLEEPPDLIVANPPDLADPLGRAYRDGGGELGTGLSQRIVEESLERLRPGGRLLLYTATPVVEGEHVIWRKLAPLLGKARADYAELDPDVFGEELERPAYSQVERIAVVGLDAVKL